MSQKFVASYSGGKDSVLAIHRALRYGWTPIALITTWNTCQDRSWFHGISAPVLQRASESMGIPVWTVKTSGEDYDECFEETLLSAKELGANGCVFGDIDIDNHRKWGEERCANTGLTALFPLWGEERKAVVREFINSGFMANIIAVDTGKIGENLLGAPLTNEVLIEIERLGADVCGENGEYHTFVSAGPIFSKPVQFSFGEKMIRDDFVSMAVK